MQTLFQIDGRAAVHSLAPLLGMGVRIAQAEDGSYWVRVETTGQQELDRLACVAGTRLVIDDNGWLLRPGDKIAIAKLPQDLKWQRLDDVMQIELPPAALASRCAGLDRQSMRLVRGGRPVAAAAIIARFGDLYRWADAASEIRLRRLRWLRRGDDVLVMGDPLPPIRASYFVAIDRILLPAGFVWAPAVTSEDVKEVFSLGEHQWLVWESNQSWSVADDDAWMSLRRASVRRSQSTQADSHADPTSRIVRLD